MSRNSKLHFYETALFALGVLLLGCGDRVETSPFSFQAVKGDDPGETRIYVTNRSGETLTNCRMNVESIGLGATVFAPSMGPNQSAETGVFNLGPGTKVIYSCDDHADVEYFIPAAILPELDTSDFDWAPPPEFKLLNSSS